MAKKEAPTATPASKVGKTEVKMCSETCKSEYQDQKYGRGRRVFNVGKAGSTCTACGKKG